MLTKVTCYSYTYFFKLTSYFSVTLDTPENLDRSIQRAINLLGRNFSDDHSSSSISYVLHMLSSCS